MSEKRRFDWDVLLEKEPEKPPIRTTPPEPVAEPELPIEFEEEEYDIPEEFEEEQTVAVPPQREKRYQPTERGEGCQAPARVVGCDDTTTNQRLEPGTEQQGRGTGPACANQPARFDILEGKVTPNQLVNSFILSEIFGKPKGLRGRGFRRR